MIQLIIGGFNQTYALMMADTGACSWAVRLGRINFVGFKWV
jgi:hypothetical protein